MLHSPESVEVFEIMTVSPICGRHTRSASVAAVVVALLATVFVVAVPSAAPAHAASTVNVNTTEDKASGGCETTGAAPACTLREAIIFANSHPGSTIKIPGGTYTLSGAGSFENEAMTGDLDILHDTTIIGSGSGATTITVALTPSGQSDRIFDITATEPSISVSIDGVTLTSGIAQDRFGGGAIWAGAGAQVTLEHSKLESNVSGESGGAIAVIGGGTTRPTSLTVADSQIDRNRFDDLGNHAANGGGGGGIYASATRVTIVNSTISSNTANGAKGADGGSPRPGGNAFGGGVFAEAGSVVSIAGSTIVGNKVFGGDGDPAAPSNSPAGQGGSGAGGGVAVQGPGTSLSITNSTLTSNLAVGGSSGPDRPSGDGRGGGIYANPFTSVVNTTIAGNQAIGGSSDLGGTPGNGIGGGVAGPNSQHRVANSVVAGNSVSHPGLLVAPNLFADIGPFTSGGHNLVGVRDGGSGFVASDLTGSAAFPLDPGLAAALALNGGPTQTLSLLPGSPAINAGDNGVCAAPLPPAAGPNGAGGVDQRGVARPQPAGGACDIGAFEYVFTPTTTSLSSSANPAAVGQAVTLTATVGAASGGTPTGTVTIRDGATSLGGGTLAGGVVTVTTAALAPGTHSITATYEGDTIFAPSTGAVSQVIGTAGQGGGPGLQFFPLARPVRLLDTRPAHTAFVQPGVPLTANQTLLLPGRFTAGSITIPPEAQALVGNATVDNTAGVPPGFATLWPSGSDLPLASNLNFVQGTVRPNAFTVGLGADGKFNLLSNTGGHFIIDITGYYAPPATGGLYFHPLTQPVRLLDTRTGADAIVHPGTPVSYTHLTLPTILRV